MTFIIITFAALSGAARSVEGRVTDVADNSPLPFCSVKLVGSQLNTQTDAGGYYLITVPDGQVSLEFSYVGYITDTLRVADDATKANVRLSPATYALHEVVVTARESEGLESGSKIDRNAMAHLQPSSLGDIMELLPGNISKNPAMGAASTIALRETGTIGATGSATVSNDYAISSLGTLFVVDGAPMATDANLQSIGTTSDASSPDYARSVTNKGVDMRSISTDNIESVEIVRGIPSAEYGNLTSGMVNIKRISRATPLTARFKADEYGKLFSVGKGFLIPGHSHVVNLDAGYLDSRPDPRDSYESYKRVNGSARATMLWMRPAANITWKAGLEYTGSFDNSKTDPDLSYGKVDEYRSSYSRWSLNSMVEIVPAELGWLDNASINTALSYENDVLTRRKQVAPSRPSAAPTTMEEGIHDGHFILGEYIADYRSEGRPFSAFVKASASGKMAGHGIDNRYKAGFEWNMAKNYGAGQVYDLMHPLSASWTSRPRRFDDIPALHQVAGFVQNTFAANTAAGKVDIQAGLRISALVGLPGNYALNGKPYLDPRINLLWHLPAVGKAVFNVGGGYGLTTRMPTVDYLFPQAHYTDLVQLSYYDINNPDAFSRLNLRTYIEEAVNPDLSAARNRKWEIRAGVDIATARLSITFFNEHLSSGFRYSSVYRPHAFTAYDASAIDPSALSAPPVLDGLPATTTTVLDGYRVATNGTRIDKQGIEWQLNTPRWRPLHTALTVTGAWFRTRYSNSQMLFSTVSDVIGNTSVSDRYVGLYDSNEGRINSQVNTNFMFDTQLTSLGLVFTTSLQCMWWVKTKAIWRNGVPTMYISADDGELHPFTPELTSDPLLGALVKTYNDAQFAPVKVPVAMYVNLKATKSIGRWLKVAVFVNRILDYLPAYNVNGLTVRRSTDAYFGMELNFTL